MRVCLIPLKTEPRSPSANLERLKQRLEANAPAKPDLICLPECTLTGYLYHEADFERFAEPIPGPTTRLMGELAAIYSAGLCFGLLEKTEMGVYNSAVLLDRQGNILLIHRENEEAPPFLNGKIVRSVSTEWGDLSVLICGDLFHARVTDRLSSSVNWVILPMSRSFSGASPDPTRWISEERGVYLDAVKAIRKTAFITNALEIGTNEPAFGGALIVGANGEIIAESPHGTDQALIWDFRAP